MKSTIISLGIAALCFNTSFAANACKSHTRSQEELTLGAKNSIKQINWATHQVLLNSGVTNNSEETAFFSPTAVLNVAQAKSIEETVLENKLITESQEQAAQPLSIEKTQQDYINEANQIIESNPYGQVFPLELNTINHPIKNEKVARHHHAGTVKLKV